METFFFLIYLFFLIFNQVNKGQYFLLVMGSYCFIFSVCTLCYVANRRFGSFWLVMTYIILLVSMDDFLIIVFHVRKLVLVIPLSVCCCFCWYYRVLWAVYSCTLSVKRFPQKCKSKVCCISWIFWIVALVFWMSIWLLWALAESLASILELQFPLRFLFW